MSGVITPDHNDALQVSRMRETTLNFSNKVRVGFIRGHDILQALNGMVMRSLNWPLSAITTTELDRMHIMAPVIKSVPNFEDNKT